MRRHCQWEFEQEDANQPNESTSSSSSPPSMAVGLRILTQQAKLPSNVVIKHSTLLSTPSKPTTAPQPPARVSPGYFSCFLQSCQLCHRKLGPAMDVYMYRGDQGFCSEECRDRQILMDEMRELEASTKKMLASSRRCYSDGPKSETRLLLEELFQRRSQMPVRKTRAVIS